MAGLYPWGAIPFLVGVLQVGGSEAELELGHVFGVVDPSRKHLGQVGREGGQTLRQVGVKTLKEKDKIKHR